MDEALGDWVMNGEQALDSVQRVSDVIDALATGRLHVPEEHQAWAKQLLALPRGATGLLDISTLTSEDLARARSTVLLLRFQGQEPREEEASIPLGLHDAQCELFRLFEKLFIGLTGVSSGLVETEEEIRGRMIERISARSNRMAQGVNSAAEEIEEFYTQNASAMFHAAQSLGGLKVVLGGQRVFGPSALTATRVAGLYCDTQLIPDPVYPFFAGDLHLNAMHLQLALVLFHILPLRPLVEARLSEPPILIFPSFEQGLERHDSVTQAGIASLALKVIGPSCNANLQSIEELQEFARSYEDKFLETVLGDRLFVPPGGNPERTLTARDAADSYLASLQGIRSEAALNLMRKLPTGSLIFNGIIERLVPQYHLLENANELAAQPMVSQQTHWHYFERCASAEARELVNAQVISRESFDVLRAIQDDSLKWLANIPVEGLADLRRNREHAGLREQLTKFTTQLASAGPADLSSVTREVRHGLEAMIQLQQKAIADIERKYAPPRWKAAAGATLGVAASACVSFLPALATVVGATAPVATAILSAAGGAVAYTNELIGEAVEKRQARKSLLGMLAIAHSKST